MAFTASRRHFPASNHSSRKRKSLRRQRVSHRQFALEFLEERRLLNSDAAYTVLTQRVAENAQSFYVYRDADSGFNHGFPSNFLASRPDLIDQLRLNLACLDDPLSASGCSTNPNRLNRERGTSLQMQFPPLAAGEFAGLGFQDPERPNTVPNARGYDLSDATHLMFEARTPLPQGLNVQVSVAGRNTNRDLPLHVTTNWKEFSIDLSDLRDPATNLPKSPDLRQVHQLMAIVMSNQLAPDGGIVLLDNVRFMNRSQGRDVAPANPTRQPSGQLAPTFPVGNHTFGVEPAVIPVVDDGDSAFTVMGDWNRLPDDAAYRDHQHTSAGATNGSSIATWTFPDLTPRFYEVQVTWLANPANASNSPFRLLDGALPRSAVSVNQKVAPQGAVFDTTADEQQAGRPRHWHSLGLVKIESGTLVVELSNRNAGGIVVADGARIVPTIPPDQAIHNLTTVYESALTVFALLDRGEPNDLAQARLIADSLVYALHHDSTAHGGELPRAPDPAPLGSRGLRDAYANGDLALFNSQGPATEDGQQGQARLAGFSSDKRLCGASGFCLVLDGAFGGNNAFGLMALMSCYFQFGDVRYLNAAKEIGEWIYGNLVDRQGPAFHVAPDVESFGGYFLGYPDQGVPKDRVADLIRGKSIENNADIFSGFMMLAAAEQALGNLTAGTSWTERANIAGDFVMAMYDPGDPANARDGRFYTGTLPNGPDGPPRGPGLEPDGPRKGNDFANIADLLDSNTFTTLALAQSPRYRAWPDRHGNPIDWREPVRHVFDTFRQQITATTNGVTRTYDGFNIVAQATSSPFRPGGPIDPQAPDRIQRPAGIAWEFTAQVIVTASFVEQLYGVTEFAAERAHYLQQLQTAQRFAPYGDGAGLVAATLDGEDDRDGLGYPPLDQCLGTPFQCIAERVGLAATTWAIFAERDVNFFAPQLPLPRKLGQAYMVEDWNNKVTRTDLGFNYFGGNMGEINNPPANTAANHITHTSLSPDVPDNKGQSLEVEIDFTRAPNPPGHFGGLFMSLFGLTDTLVSFDRSPGKRTFFPGYFLNFDDLFRGFGSVSASSVDEIRFEVKLAPGSPPFTLKVELKEEPTKPGGPQDDIFRHITIDSESWTTIRLQRSDFNDSLSGRGNLSAFDWTRVSGLAFIIEREIRDSVTGTVIGQNPSAIRFRLDNLVLVDQDGATLDLSKARDPHSGELLPFYEQAFLDYVRESSSRYFVDFASTDPRTGGMIQDRSTFADLMTVGGAGFQLTSYVIDAERGYLTRAEAADRVHKLLKVLAGHPQGPQPVGTIGHEGFFYHFLGVDGLRKQNFDRTETVGHDESLNTVELSTIDTALAVAGAVTAGEYFQGATTIESEIRQLANTIYARVNWPFMLNSDPGADSPRDERDMLYLGWKPLENRDGPAFDIPDARGEGHYSGTGRDPAVVDFYTDEGLLIALLAMGSPNPAHRLPRDVWDALIRERDGGSFVRTFPGALFTYEFASLWLDTEALGLDTHRAIHGRPASPVNFFLNSRDAVIATRQYTMLNPNNRATWRDGKGATRWGLSAAEGPFDHYFAYGAPGAAQRENLGEFVSPPANYNAQAETGSGAGSPMFRSNAAGGATIQLDAGESRTIPIEVPFKTTYEMLVWYSNDNFGPLENITVSINGQPLGSFAAEDTGDFGLGWNQFQASPALGPIQLGPGTHLVTLTVAGGDGGGVEIDQVTLRHGSVHRPLEDGTATIYGAGSAIKYAPELAIPALWEASESGWLHPRFGFADAFNSDIVDAVLGERPGGQILRTSGPWANLTGFSIDHGPMLIQIDNYLSGDFIPSLFMSNSAIRRGLRTLDWLPPNPWHNHQHAFDVDDNRAVTFFDASLILRVLANGGAGRLPSRTLAAPPFLDVTDDGNLTTSDLIGVLRELSNASGEGETEAQTPRRPLLDHELLSRQLVDAAFAQFDADEALPPGAWFRKLFARRPRPN